MARNAYLLCKISASDLGVTHLLTERSCKSDFPMASTSPPTHPPSRWDSYFGCVCVCVCEGVGGQCSVRLLRAPVPSAPSRPFGAAVQREAGRQQKETARQRAQEKAGGSKGRKAKQARRARRQNRQDKQSDSEGSQRRGRKRLRRSQPDT